MSVTGHAPDNLPPPYDWRMHAACRHEDPEIMFPTASDAHIVANLICTDCPVLAACRRWALDHPQEAAYGVWGGLTEKQRAAILRRRIPQDPDTPDVPRKGGRPRAECGTAAAYDRHIKHKQKVDDACRTAKRKRDTDYRARTKAVA